MLPSPLPADPLTSSSCSLQVIDVVQSGLINWRRVNLDSTSRYKKVENGNLVIEVGKSMKLSLINIGGLDIVDGNKKMILAVIWQLMRRYTLKVLEDLAKYQGISDLTEDHIIAWANAKVRAAGKGTLLTALLCAACAAVWASAC